MKKAAVFVLMSSCAFAVTYCSGQEEPSSAALEPGASSAFAAPQAAVDLAAMPDVVARVNETEIKKDELIARAQMIQGQLPGGAARDTVDFYRRVLDDLVTSELLYQASVAKGFIPTQAQVDEQLAVVRSQFPDQAQFEQSLQSQGLTEEKLREILSRSLGIQQLVETDLTAGIEITADQTRSYYQNNLDRMKRPEQVRLSHILVMADENATPEQREEAKKKIEDVRARAIAGEDFATLARENSDDPGSKANGGELDWVQRGDTVPPFEAAAFALSPGEISEVVETRYGYHVIKLAERKEGESVSFEEAEPRIEKLLRDQEVQQRLRGAIETLKTSGDVQIFI